MVAQTLARAQVAEPHARIERLLMYVRLHRVRNIWYLWEKVYLTRPYFLYKHAFQDGTCTSIKSAATTVYKVFAMVGWRSRPFLQTYPSSLYALLYISSKGYQFNNKLHPYSRYTKIFSGARIYLKPLQTALTKENPSDAPSITSTYSSNSHISVSCPSSRGIFRTSQHVLDTTHINNTSSCWAAGEASTYRSSQKSTGKDTVLAENGIEVNSMLAEPYDYYESHTLKKIDGFLVTDGKTRPRITLKDSLSHREKQRGRAVLCQHLVLNAKPGVYLWRTTD